MMVGFYIFMRTSSAGMTKESVRLRRTEGLGVSPSFLISPQEWGTEKQSVSAGSLRVSLRSSS
jgi:hypothetical protein